MPSFPAQSLRFGAGSPGVGLGPQALFQAGPQEPLPGAWSRAAPAPCSLHRAARWDKPRARKGGAALRDSGEAALGRGTSPSSHITASGARSSCKPAADTRLTPAQPQPQPQLQGSRSLSQATCCPPPSDMAGCLSNTSSPAPPGPALPLPRCFHFRSLHVPLLLKLFFKICFH